MATWKVNDPVYGDHKITADKCKVEADGKVVTLYNQVGLVQDNVAVFVVSPGSSVIREDSESA